MAAARLGVETLAADVLRHISPVAALFEGEKVDTKGFEFMYKGKTIKVTEEHPEAVISVDGREFSCHHHHSEAGLDMWMCNEAYFAEVDLKAMARHFADYQYLYDRPGRIIVDEEGQVVEDSPVGGHHGGAKDDTHDHSGQGKGE